MKRGIITSIFIVILLSACATTNNMPMGKFDFIDMHSFDKDLSTAMKTKEETIEISPLVKFSPNEIPDRLGKWFYTIDKKGGEVNTEDLSPKTKGFPFGSGIVLLLDAYGKIRDKILYNPASKYNATVYYKSEEGLVEKVVFTRKTE